MVTAAVAAPALHTALERQLGLTPAVDRDLSPAGAGKSGGSSSGACTPTRRATRPARDRDEAVRVAPTRQAGGHWFEPSTAHFIRLDEWPGRMAPSQRFAGTGAILDVVDCSCIQAR